jgi:AcrR family transcriptional regulator
MREVAMKTTGSRRAELLALAASLFAERGYVSTTVRDIADAAGIRSGSLYHHFYSKESMADEILTGFLDELFGTYEDIMAAGKGGPRETLEAVVVASFESIHRRPAEVAIYQSEAKHLMQLPRFAYLNDRNAEFRRLWNRILTDGVRDLAARTSMSNSSTGSSATRCGSPCAGTTPVARSSRVRSRNSIWGFCSTASRHPARPQRNAGGSRRRRDG